ncbi:MAG: GspH/FimT family pseudopilin [Candidatus Competibacteraceae bacterium]|nr:GspH/FimT family pseudopilin [Candidatus Competibacteraceae bacterium]
MYRQPGFTLIELIITLAIAAIVLTIGVPSFQEMMRNNRAATHANEFMNALNLARSEAVKRGQGVSLCPSTDQATCTGGGDWKDGWIVFIDADANGNGIQDEFATDSNGAVDNGEFLLRVYEPLAGSPVFNGPSSIRYLATGSITPTATQQISYTLNTINQAVCISPVGRPHIEKDSTICP